MAGDGPASVAVVGGGAVGLTAAVELAARGASVTLYERDDLGSGATGRAAGLCYDAYADRVDARVAARSLAAFRDLDLLIERPYVWVAREGDDHVAAAIREQVAAMRERGRDVELLAPTGIADRFPALRTDHLQVGAVAHNAGYVDTDAYVAAMAERAGESGVAVETHTEVDLADTRTVRTPDGTSRYDAVLLAAGAHTDRLAASADCSLALGRYRAQALVTEAVDVSPPLLYDASERFYARPEGDGLLVGDGAHAYAGDPDAADRRADDSFVADSLARVETAFGVSPAAVRSWAGLCTATPDRDPLVGAAAPGLFVATGWHGHGFMRAPALGRTVAEQILGGEGIDHFDPCRFDGDERVDLPAGIVD
ncbi:MULTISPECIES: NAD(P)/FAD-dependent oxidoreductase [Salinibaculum]|uniref:NAD(P)/FAD-dependent oxidoreductase n=1 Tax=Salinibaculum TaxID=2732368 RepID=UPI0030D5FA15